MTTPIYLMSPPRPDWALRGRANFKSRAAGGVDAVAARREWSQLADAIVEAGGEVVVLPPGGAELTGLIYTAEAGEFCRDDEGNSTFILPNMAAEHRRGEAEHIAWFVEDELEMKTRRVESVWEAQGDAIRAEDGKSVVHTYGVGPDRRTEDGAYGEVAHLLSERHIQIAFEADPWFHGNTFLQFFQKDDQSIMVVCPEALRDGEFERLRQFAGEMPVVEITAEESRGYDTNALQVGTTVLAPQTFSKTTRRAVEQLGLEVRIIHLGELFSKGGGAPVCLTNRMWGLEVSEVPETVRWSMRSATQNDPLALE